VAGERIPRITVHDLTERELLILRQETDTRKKSATATWLLWLFLAEFGAHRFYLDRIGTGIAMLLNSGWPLNLGFVGRLSYPRDA